MYSMNSFEAIEKTLDRQVRFLNAELYSEGCASVPEFMAVLAQARKELAWFFNNSEQKFTEQQLLIFYQIACLRAVQAMYPSVLIAENMRQEWIGLGEVLVEYEQQFETTSCAGQARQQLDNECKNMIMALEVLRTRTDELYLQSRSINDSYARDKEVFMAAYTKVLADVHFYHAWQSVAIKETGGLNPNIRQFTQAKCLATITKASQQVNKSSSFSDLLKSMAVSVLGWFGCAKATDKTAGSYAFYQPQHSGAKLAYAKNIVRRTFSPSLA